ACTLRSVVCRLLEQTVIERLREAIFTPDYIKAEVAHATALLAAQPRESERKVRQAEAAEAVAREALENPGNFIARHGANAVIEGQYQGADRAWRLASAALAVARAEQHHIRPLRVAEAEAEHYVSNLVAHMQDGDVGLQRQFLAAFIRRIVRYDDEGMIELVE